MNVLNEPYPLNDLQKQYKRVPVIRLLFYLFSKMEIINIKIIFVSILIMNIPVTLVQSMIEDQKCIGSGKHCYCDESCDFYGDCCNKSPPVSMNKSLFSCSNGYYVIDKCPSDYLNKFSERSCEEEREVNSRQLIFHVPVYGIHGNTRYLYKNVFCAICNGISQYQFANVKKESSGYRATLIIPRSKSKIIKLTTESNILEIMNPYEIQYEIPESFKRVCYSQITSTCPFLANKVFARLCQEEPTFYIKTSRSATYRNAYCYICNKIIEFNTDSILRESSFSPIDFNQWCLNDCQILLQSFLANQSSSINSSINTIQETNLIVTFERVIAVIFSIISMTSLLFLLFVYTCVEDQDNIASRITICLASSILLLTLMNIVLYSMDNHSNHFCFYFSIIYHYCFLSSFFWMSIFALDVYRSLTSTHVSNKRHCQKFSSSKLRAYGLVGYVAPFALIMTTLIIQLVNENNILSAGFGERQCFINRLIGGLVWFFIPLCICLLVNVIVCICLYRFIYLAHQQTAIATNTLKARKQSFVLCMKLSILFGAIWLPAFVGIFLDNYILKFVGGILSSLQGSVVSICFIFGVQTQKKTYQYFRSMTSSRDRSIEHVSSKLNPK